MCTLFPDRVLPVVSSLLINYETLLGDWEDFIDVLEYHAEQATKQKYTKFDQNHLKELDQNCIWPDLQ